MVLRAGRLRHRLTLQKAAEAAADSFGLVAERWTTEAKVWGRVEALGGRELERAKQVAPKVSHRVTLRHRGTLFEERRLLWPRNQTTLAAAISSTSATSISLSAALGLSTSTRARIRIDDEIMVITAGQDGTSPTVERGADGTTAATHDNAATVTRLAVLEIEAIQPDESDGESMVCLCKESP